MPTLHRSFRLLLACTLVLWGTSGRSQVLDPSFGWGGYVSFPFSYRKEVPYHVSVAADGRIYASGTRLTQYPDENPDWWVACFHPDGTCDSTFGTGGITYWNVCTGNEYTLDLDADTSGNVFILGNEEYGAVNGLDRGLLGKLRPNGTPDPTYGLYAAQPGLAFVSAPGSKVHALAMVKRPDGSRNAVFRTLNAYFTGTDHDVYIVKIDTTGKVDSTFLAPASGTALFGSTGYGLTAIGRPDGGFYISGCHSGMNPPEYIAKIGADGALDATYGNNGFFTLPSILGYLPGYQEVGMFLDNAGRLTFKSGSGLVRLLPQGTLDMGFGQGGILNEPVGATLVDTAGQVYTVMNDTLYRFSTAGQLDLSFGVNGKFPLVRPVEQFCTMAFSPDGTRLVILQNCRCSDNPPYSGQIDLGTEHLTAIDLTSGGTTTSVAAIQASSLRIYPNPASDHVRISTTDMPPYRLEVLDACGRQAMVRDRVASRDLTLDVSKLSPGSYLIRLVDQKGKVSDSRLSIVH